MQIIKSETLLRWHREGFRLFWNLKSRGKDSWTCDFVPELTRFLHTIHAFVIVHLERRRVVHFGAMEHPTAEWVAPQLREAMPCEEKPKYLI